MTAAIINNDDISFNIPLTPLAKNRKVQLIKEIAYTAFKELAVSLVFTTITAFFIPTTLSIAAAFTAAAVMVLFNVLVRCFPAYTNYQLFALTCRIRQLKTDSIQCIRTSKEIDRLESLQEELEKKNRVRTNIANFICPTVFASFDAQTFGVLRHEAGHAIAAIALYQNSKPKIVVNGPFNGGVTTFYPGALTKLGESVGRKNVELIVAGAGAGISILFSCISLVLSRKFRDSHPQLSRYFLSSAIAGVVHHVFYAISAFFTSKENLSHDFVRLWTGGIHPIVSIITMVAIPLIVKGCFLLYDYCKERWQARQLNFVQSRV